MRNLGICFEARRHKIRGNLSVGSTGVIKRCWGPIHQTS